MQNIFKAPSELLKIFLYNFLPFSMVFYLTSQKIFSSILFGVQCGILLCERKEQLMSSINAEETAYQAIVKMVLSKEFAPGDRLIENEIAEELGLSRTPVRNALRKLTAVGFLENPRNRGCSVPKLNPQDMEEAFESRRLIESYAAGEAAVRAKAASLDHLEKLLDRQEKLYSQRDVQGFHESNREFHSSIVALGGNSYINRFFQQAFWRAELYIIFFDRFYRLPEEMNHQPLRDPAQSATCRDHRRIFAAILAREADQARHYMAEHVRTTYINLTRYSVTLQARPFPW